MTTQREGRWSALLAGLRRSAQCLLRRGVGAGRALNTDGKLERGLRTHPHTAHDAYPAVGSVSALGELRVGQQQDDGRPVVAEADLERVEVEIGSRTWVTDYFVPRTFSTLSARDVDCHDDALLRQYVESAYSAGDLR